MCLTGWLGVGSPGCNSCSTVSKNQAQSVFLLSKNRSGWLLSKWPQHGHCASRKEERGKANVFSSTQAFIPEGKAHRDLCLYFIDHSVTLRPPLAARVWEGKYFTFRSLKQKHARGEGVGLGVNLTPYVYNNECNLGLPSSSANYEMVSQ